MPKVMGLPHLAPHAKRLPPSFGAYDLGGLLLAFTLCCGLALTNRLSTLLRAMPAVPELDLGGVIVAGVASWLAIRVLASRVIDRSVSRLGTAFALLGMGSFVMGALWGLTSVVEVGYLPNFDLGIQVAIAIAGTFWAATFATGICLAICPLLLPLAYLNVLLLQKAGRAANA